MITLQIPLENVNSTTGVIFSKRLNYLSAKEVASILSVNRDIEIYIASVGKPPLIVSGKDIYKYWQKEKSNIVADPNHIQLEDYPCGYAILASRWTNETFEKEILVFEVYH